MWEWAQKQSRWDKGLLVLVAFYLFLWPFEPVIPGVGAIREPLQGVIYILGSIAVVRYSIKGVRILIGKFLWRVRRRMAAVYVFVGLIPLTLAVTLAGLGTALLFGPLAAYMVTSKVEQRAAELHAAAASFGWEIRATEPSRRREAGLRFIQDAQERFPGIVLRVETAEGAVAGFPAWLLEEKPPAGIEQYQGVVRRDSDLFLAAHAQYSPDALSVLLMVPPTGEYLAALLPGLGVVERFDFEAALEPLREIERAHKEDDGPPSAEERRRREGLVRRAHERLLGGGSAGGVEKMLPPQAHGLDFPIRWPAQARVLHWSDRESELETVFALRSRYSAVAGILFSNQSMQIAQAVRIAGYVLLGLFCGAVVVSLIVAISLTRTLTRTVHDLYRGTERVNRSDFSHRIQVRGNDQLSDLSRSFNTMTESIERLIEESREHERLQSELEIAREVQARMFPREAPKLASLEVLGVCRPAEVVSGDFYDYIQLSPSRMALAFGDVSGKGISAALVMATLHSIVRTQLSLLAHSNGEFALSTAELVSRTNRRLYTDTSDEKFATLFFAGYDEREGVLSYSNAGHLPPLLIRGDDVQRLEVTGMVAGVFPDSTYESRQVELEPGDTLVAFTDGLTEPENAYEEEFGEQRFCEAVLRHVDRPSAEMIAAVMQEVIDWTGESSLQDDMTMLVAKRR